MQYRKFPPPGQDGGQHRVEEIQHADNPDNAAEHTADHQEHFLHPGKLADILVLGFIIKGHFDAFSVILQKSVHIFQLFRSGIKDKGHQVGIAVISFQGFGRQDIAVSPAKTVAECIGDCRNSGNRVGDIPVFCGIYGPNFLHRLFPCCGIFTLYHFSCNLVNKVEIIHIADCHLIPDLCPVGAFIRLGKVVCVRDSDDIVPGRILQFFNIPIKDIQEA